MFLLDRYEWGPFAALCCALTFILLAIVSVGALIFAVVRIPEDYFEAPHPPCFLVGRHPLVRCTALLAKNFLGAALVLIGILLAIPGIPGQGLLTIFVGIMLLDFPGKRRLELKLIRYPAILRPMNWLRLCFVAAHLRLGPPHRTGRGPA